MATPVQFNGTLASKMNGGYVTAVNKSQAVGTTSQNQQSIQKSNPSAPQNSAVSINEGMRFHVKKMTKSVENLQNNISKLDTADQGMQTTQNALKKMKELATKATDETLTADQRKKLQDDLKKYQAVIDKTANKTTADDKKLLDGSYKEKLQSGASENHTSNVKIGNLSSKGLKVDSADLSSADAAKKTLKDIEAAEKRVTTERAQVKQVNDKMKQTALIQSSVVNSLSDNKKPDEVKDAQQAKQLIDQFKNNQFTASDLVNMLKMNNNAAISLLFK